MHAGPITATQIGIMGGDFFSKMRLAAGADPAVTATSASYDPYGQNIKASFDVFRYYLAQIPGVPAGLPNASQAMGASTVPTLTLGQYWKVMRQWLTQNYPALNGPAR